MSVYLCEQSVMISFCEPKHVAGLAPLQCRLCSTGKMAGFVLFFRSSFFFKSGKNHLEEPPGESPIAVK